MFRLDFWGVWGDTPQPSEPPHPRTAHTVKRGLRRRPSGEELVRIILVGLGFLGLC